jgi:surface antigen
MTAIFMGAGLGGCSVSRSSDAFARMDGDREITGSIGRTTPSTAGPTDGDLAFARNAASDVLTKGLKDSSQPWENPSTGARGSVTPLATSYTAADGRMCHDFLASYVNGTSETWLQGAACRSEHGRWDIHTLKPWRKS